VRSLAERARGAAGSVELDAEWRARAARAQAEAMPSGRVAVSCPAPFGVGGLGRHLQEIVDALRRREAQVSCAAEALPAHAASARGEDRERACVRQVQRSRALAAALSPLARASTPLAMWASLVGFDYRAARALRDSLADGDGHLIAFNGAALRQFRRARSARARSDGRPSLRLVSATAHIRTVVSRHELAYAQYPHERSWAPRLVARTLAEYEEAEVIYVSSQRVRDSFLAEGVREERLVQFPLTPDPRFDGARAHPGPAGEAGAYEVVYVGSLSVVKGVPLLVDAVSRLRHKDLRLVLVGGWGTRGMHRFIERARARDERVSVILEDPLSWLRRASLYVHPSYDDGFGYAPAEALAAGIPVVATDSTGMRDLIVPGRNGAIVKGGDVGALAEAIDAGYRGELLGADTENRLCPTRSQIPTSFR
jgi:glycosyltransferase involved in cell wall biosynthesis